LIFSKKTWHKIIIGNCEDMHELSDESIHLMITSPPYYNAPFDYPGLFKTYDDYLELLRNLAEELKRVIAPGRIMAFVIDDTLVNGHKYPIVADITKIFIDKGFKYRDKIIWRKPEGYIRISRRSGVLIQHPYPMYFYPDNLQESILLFQKGKFNYQKYMKTLDPEIIEASKIDLEESQSNKWYLSVWDITNVLPLKNRIEKGIAAFPEEIPYRLIKLFSYVNETVLDPFLGSGTTTKMARELGRNSYGYDIDIELVEVIKKKLNVGQTKLKGTLEPPSFTIREDHENLRAMLDVRVSNQRSAVKRYKIVQPLSGDATHS